MTYKQPTGSTPWILVALMVIVIVLTEGGSQFRVLNQQVSLFWSHFVGGDRVSDQVALVNLLEDDYVGFWRGNVQYSKDEDVPLLTVVEPHHKEARLSFQSRLDLRSVESLRFSLFHEPLLNHPRIILGLQDVDGHTLTSVLVEELSFQEWEEVSFDVSSFVDDHLSSFDFSQVEHLWLSSTSPENERVVFQIRDLAFYGAHELHTQGVSAVIRKPLLDLLDSSRLSFWKGNVKPQQMGGRSILRVVEPDASEARAVYAERLDFSRVQQIRFDIFYRGVSKDLKLLFVVEDANGHTLSVIASENLPSKSWETFALSRSFLEKEAEKRQVSLSLDQIEKMWISSILPEDQRIVYDLRNIFLFD